MAYADGPRSNEQASPCPERVAHCRLQAGARTRAAPSHCTGRSTSGFETLSATGFCAQENGFPPPAALPANSAPPAEPSTWHTPSSPVRVTSSAEVPPVRSWLKASLQRYDVRRIALKVRLRLAQLRDPGHHVW